MKQNWTYKKFSEVFNLQMGKTPSRDNLSYWGGDNIWVSIADMKGKYIDSTKEHITDFAVSESKIHKVPQGTAIMSFKLTIGRAAIAKCDLFTNEAIMSFEPKDANILLPDYVFYYLKGCKWAGANKAVMGQTLNKKTISENTFAYPPLSIQSHIVSELDLLQSLIDKQKAQLKELDNLAQAIFYDMFGNPVENEKGWEVKKIEEVCSSIVRGPFGSALKKEFFVEPSETTYKVYEQKHAIQKNANIGSYYISKDRFETLKRFEVKSGDIIMSCSGTIGEFFEIPVGAERGLMNQALLKFTLNQKIDKAYFLFTMEFVKDNFDKKGTGLQNIGSVGMVKSTPISLPPLSLQQSFAQKIEAIERQKKLINQSIAEALTLFDSRMEYYFGE